MTTNKLIKKALSKYRSGDKKAAINLYKKLLREDPNHLDANYLLGAVLAEMGQLDDAIKYSHKADSIPPASHLIKNNLGNLYRMKGDYQNALACFKACLSINPHFAQAYNNLGIVYHHQHSLEEAAQAYRQAIAIEPNFVEAHFNLGNVLTELEQHEQAESAYKQVLLLKPDHSAAHDRLASHYIKCGNNASAIEHLNAYLELDPQDRLGAALRLAYLNAGDSPEYYPPELVVQTYEKKAKNWDQDICRPDMEFLGPTHVKDTVSQLFSSTSPVLDILDLGCGTGVCGEFLKPFAKQLTGVDLSQAMLDQAKTKALYDQLFCDEILHHLQTHSHAYDLITASGVVIFFGNLLPLFNALKESLREEGKAILTTYKGDKQDYYPRQNFHFAHSSAYLKRIAESVGLHVDALQEIVHEYDFGQAQPGYLVVLSHS